MKIVVCTCTYLRPKLLGYLIHCFCQQTHEDREMVILDDAGQYDNQRGDRWRLVSVNQRYPTLGAKRNAVVRMAGLVLTGVDALCAWDDDDLVMPWALEALNAALEQAEWARPSLALAVDGGSYGAMVGVKTYFRPDQDDKAFHAAWGVRREAFDRVGGYPPELSVTEDRHLAIKLRAAGVTECDPIALGYRPYYFADPGVDPWTQEKHLSYTGDLYDEFGKRHADRRAFVTPEPPPVYDVVHPRIASDRVLDRAWGGDWWKGPAQ